MLYKVLVIISLMFGMMANMFRFIEQCCVKNDESVQE